LGAGIVDCPEVPGAADLATEPAAAEAFMVRAPTPAVGTVLRRHTLLMHWYGLTQSVSFLQATARLIGTGSHPRYIHTCARQASERSILIGVVTPSSMRATYHGLRWNEVIGASVL
jgi:hypothetical protein